MSIDTTQIILVQITEAIGSGQIIRRFTWFETILYFIDELILNNSLQELMAEKKSSLVIRKTKNNHPSRYSILQRYKNTYIFSILSRDYKLMKTDTYAFILFVQHFIVEFAMALYNKLDTKLEFTCQGSFYNCLLRALFSIKKPKSLFVMEYKYFNHPYFPVLMENWSNSCFLDSLIIILLLGDCEYVRSILLKEKNFSFVDEYGNFRKPSVEDITDTNDKAIAYAFTLRQQLKTEHEMMLGYVDIGKPSYMCINLRQMLTLTNPGMINQNSQHYVSYSADEIYGTLVNLYENLKYILPILYPDGREGAYIFDSVSMQDFILGMNTSGGSYEIVWDKIDTPFLVFKNTMGIRFPNYALGKKHSTAFVADQTANPVTYAQYNADAVRWFGEYILNGRYRLFGVLMHSGEVENPASHYYAYIRPFFDKYSWYLYDDIKYSGRPAYNYHGHTCPQAAFMDNGAIKPEMFFYVKI